jgi:hypothetical protein
MTFMRFASPGAMVVAFLKFRFRLVDLLVRMWLEKALCLTIFPVPDFLNRLAAPLFVFILGMEFSQYFR